VSTEDVGTEESTASTSGNDASSEERSTQEKLEDAGATFVRALGNVMDVLFDQAKVELETAAKAGRSRLELRQLKKDLAAMYTKFGREMMELVESSAITHEDALRGAGRISELQERIQTMEGQISDYEAALAEAAAERAAAFAAGAGDSAAPSDEPAAPSED